MRGAAETKQVTTLTLSMTPQEAKELAEAAEASLRRLERDTYFKQSAEMLLQFKTLENLIAAIGVALGDVPRGDR
jgi:hypothetical protein